MKSKYLFLAFAASAALVGCQNEEMITNEGIANSKVIDASGIRFAVSKDDAATRAAWEESDGAYTFYWTGKEDIGVAYIGDAGNEMASQGVTNYKFRTDSLKLASFKKVDGQARWTGYYEVKENGTLENLDEVKKAYTKANSAELVQDDLGKSQNAKFRTPNDYIFEGYYAVYYPFDGSYAKKGYIPVKSPESMIIKNDLSDNLEAAAASTFSYSKPQTFKAGDNVAEFKLQQLSGMLKLNIRNNTGSEISTVQKILIVSNQEFTVSGKLNSVDAAPSASVISDAKTASALEVKFSSAAWNADITAAAVTLPVYDVTDAASTKSVYIPMLPKNGFTGMDVYLIDKNGAAIKVAKTANFNITSAAVQPVGIDIPANAEFNNYIAYDIASLEAVAKNAPDGSTINVLKPIEIKKAVAIANKVTISGKPLTLSTGGALTFGKATTVVDNEIIANGGELTPTNAEFGRLTINEEKELALVVSGKFAEIVNNGKLTLGNGTDAASINAAKITNNGLLAIKNNASVNPTSSALDNKGEVYQYVGSIIGAKSLTNATDAVYTCEVVNQLKFDEAVERKATKIVLAGGTKPFAIPATGAENITIQFDTKATLKNESTDNNGVTTYITGKVKAVISNDGTNTYATIDQNLTVTGDINVNEGKYLKVAKNRTVNVAGLIILAKDAKFEREQGGDEDVEAKVFCLGIVTGDGAEWVSGEPNY